MFKGIILVLVVFTKAQLIQSLKPCKTYDTICFTNTANDIFHIAINGDTSMNIERLDPIKQEYIEGNLAIIKYKLFNSTIVGFKDCNVVDANVTLEENSMHFKLICPYVYMYGIYEISGLLVSVPIKGKGDYTLSTKDYHIFIETATKITKSSDGKSYLNIKNFIVNGDLKGELIADLKNLFNGENKELVINLHRCKTVNDVCVTNAVKAAYPLILKPNADIGAEEMDPLFHEIIEGDLSMLKYKFFNSTIIGFKTCEVETAKFVDHNEDVLRINLLCPRFHMYGFYDIKGQLFHLDIEGNGDFVLEIKKYSISVDLDLKTSTRHGKSYKSIKSFKTKGEALEKVAYDFKNLFNGRQDLAEVVLKFVNENWKEVADAVQNPGLIAHIKKIVKNANAYLKIIPIDEYQSQ